MKKRAGLYIRVSTEEQVENYSIPVQKKRLHAYCESHDWAVAEEYIDGGFSGAKLERPAMQKMILDAKAGNLDVIVSMKLDRLSRSQKDTLHLIEDIFIPHQVDYVSVNESFDTGTSFGRAMVGILSVFAQLEREQILERMHSGMVARARIGYYHGPRPPFGYQLEKGVLIKDNSEAPIVNKVYSLFLNGLSYSQISRLMGEKYPEKAWHCVSLVKNMLSNPAYIGKINFNGEDINGQHEGIVSNEVFEQAQVLIGSRPKWQGKQTHHLLSGIIWCAKCGNRYGIKSSVQKCGSYTYYICSPNRKRKGQEWAKKCKSKNWPTAKLEELVIGNIRKLAFNREYFEELANPDNGTTSAINALETEIAACDKQTEKLMDLYSVEGVPVETLSKKINVLYAKKKKLETELSQFNKPRLQSYDDYKEIFESVDRILASEDMDKKKALVRSLIKRIEINDEDVNIIFTFQNG